MAIPKTSFHDTETLPALLALLERNPSGARAALCCKREQAVEQTVE